MATDWKAAVEALTDRERELLIDIADGLDVDHVDTHPHRVGHHRRHRHRHVDGIAVGVSRRTATGEPEGGWTPHEILPIEAALSAYSAGVAYQAFAEDHWGRIAPGVSADLVWLDRDPRGVPALELPAVAVRATYLRGEPAHPTEGVSQ